MHLIKDYVQDLKCEFAGYNGKRLGRDLMAGITVAAVALPLALAFGVSSGATAAAGLVTAILSGVAISLLSGASFQISGPTGAMTAILVTLAAKYGMQGILISCFFAGIILVAAGVLKLGRIIYYIPSSVITGFTSGIAIIIALGQLDNFFGVTSKGDLAIVKVLSYFTSGFSPNFAAMGIGLAVILIMIAWPAKWNSKVPSSLAALILILIFNHFAGLDVAVVGEIPKTLFLEDRLQLSAINPSQFWDFFVPALSIAALAMIESLLCGASAGKMKKESINGDRELVAQGVGNILIPLFGGVPATAAIARTSVAIKAGCETRLTGVFHAVILLLSMFILSPIMSEVPLSALAGILIVTAWRMNDWENIRFIFSHKFKTGMLKFFITMAATVVLDLTQAIIIGVAFSAFMIVVKLTDIDITIADIENERLEEIGINIPQVSKTIRMAYLTGTIFFAVTDKLKKQLTELGNTEILILSMRGVPAIDLSGIQALLELEQELAEDGVTVMLSSVQPKVLEGLQRGGLIDKIGKEHVFESAEYAIMRAQKEVEA
ncbi:SulP family inorganic anion transporter [Anaerovorax odorimutans]|uniref:SulP family inorganic anion transporter n=1 Tax=Anaerovorax odorimutans TaxID=109327 RepID=A0ABT1RRA9_9FIRM|nr:SulP family inorganic anion transporter [Anaerovorax odorimutans]MCQ4637720.1 SulP family inorganic anion transporter [Anaerovorax odorimutans]